MSLQYLIAVCSMIFVAMCATGASQPFPFGPMVVSVSAADETFAKASLTEVSLSVTIERLVSNVNTSHTYSQDLEVLLNLNSEDFEVLLKKASIEAQTELAERVDAIINLLTSANVEKLRTSSVSLRPIYHYLKDQSSRQIGTRASNTLTFREKTTEAGPLLTSLIDVGATNVDGIKHVATDEEVERVLKMAISNAVNKAKERGELAMSEAGCRGRIVTTQMAVDTPDGGSVALPEMNKEFAARADGGGSVSMQIVGGENKVSARVTMRMECH
jgi:hypothetical protein